MEDLVSAYKKGERKLFTSQFLWLLIWDQPFEGFSNLEHPGSPSDHRRDRRLDPTMMMMMMMTRRERSQDPRASCCCRGRRRRGCCCCRRRLLKKQQQQQSCG